MESIDLHYLCTTIGNLSGIPIRIYEGENQTFSYSIVRLPKDPMELYRKALWEIKEHVSYYATPNFSYYGLVNHGATKIIIGPTRQLPETDQELRELAFQLALSGDEVRTFENAMRAIVHMPIESVLQMLCTINHVLNGEKLELKDIRIYEAEQKILETMQVRSQAAQSLTAQDVPLQTGHNTLDQEQTILRMVRKGDSAGLQAWFDAAPAIRGGIVANDQLRQQKNLFVVTVTLASRAAIQGGMQVDDAFSLSDSYLQQCELLTSPERITNLQYRMLLDYTARVERLRRGGNPSKLVLDVTNYIQHHISEPIRAEEIAGALFISRPYLSKKFKEETGQSLTDFILSEKAEEAKRLLRYSEKPLTAISTYLAFSSPSHFSRVFKQYAGILPREYREKYG